MSIKEIVENCISDRKQIYNSHSDSFVKKYSVDLIIKIIILLINSLGVKNFNSKNTSYFVDEINNYSMSKNLINTYEKSIKSGNKSLLVDYYRINLNNSHIKIGVIIPIVLIIFVTFSSMLVLIIDIITAKSFCLVLKFLALIQILYINLINTSYVSNCYLMTDHHFYSSIFALVNSKYLNTIVLQHGIIGDSFFYPIRANVFYAWGLHSKEILNYDKKVKIVGTYKFDNLKFKGNGSMLSSNDNVTKIMYCVSTLSKERTFNEISKLCNFINKYDNFELIVKDHPGSLFNKIHSIDFRVPFKIYKDESIDEIDFDLAVVGRSTIILDLAVLKKPFIYYDKSFDYFSEYKDVLLSVNNTEELYYSILNYKSFDFSNLFSKLYSSELNNLCCSIF